MNAFGLYLGAASSFLIGLIGFIASGDKATFQSFMTATLVLMWIGISVKKEK